MTILDVDVSSCGVQIIVSAGDVTTRNDYTIESSLFPFFEGLVEKYLNHVTAIRGLKLVCVNVANGQAQFSFKE